MEVLEAPTLLSSLDCVNYDCIYFKLKCTLEIGLLREEIASLKRQRVLSSDASRNATATFVNGGVYDYRRGNVPG